jgi:general secretion pathway protein D
MHSTMPLPSHRRICAVPLVLVCLLFHSPAATAQPLAPDQASTAESSKKTDSAMVKLNFPEEIDLKLLVEYVSTRLGVKILYGEEVAKKKISIKAPSEIPAQSLMNLLESALKMKELALVDADVPGWKQIVSSSDLTRISRPGQIDRPLEDIEATIAVTQAFPLTHIAPDKASQIIKPFLTEPGANTITLPDQKLLIITDYAGNLQRIADLLKTLDRAGPPSVLEFYTVEHLEATELAKQITSLLSARSAEPAERPQISHDERTNQMIIVGPREAVDQVLQLVKTLDVPLGLSTEVYSFEYVAAERIDMLVQELVDPLTIKRLYRSAIDQEDNMLIVTATDEIHERIAWLKKQMDIESKRPGSSVKFYQLKNASAEEVLQTLMSIQQTDRSDYGELFQQRGPRGVSPLGRGPTGTAGYSLGQPFRQPDVPGPNYPNTPQQVEPTLPPAYDAQSQQAQAQPATADSEGAIAALPTATMLTADPFTNSIIVVGDRSVQEVYKNLIEFLDRRRPQVMIEARVVIIDTSDDFSMGVEISTGDRSGLKRLLEFTSYGLSAVDPVSGALSIIPGRGFNWTLVDPDSADAVLRALATHRRARVTSAPRVLVNDNATGTLASVTEVPFTSVNASNTVATTSFAGFAEAGTTIEVTPRISDDNHLVLDYVVTLNSFTGSGGAGVPPPRQTDEVRSTVTIPDGHTVIVGGLNRSNSALSNDGIPYVENIPLLRELTSVRTTSRSQTTLFVFLRPVILRDDKFRDLQYLSDKDSRCAGCRTDYPSSQPMLVK